MERRAPRVLMLAHAFPPAGGSGSNRALAFARYLPMYGWRPLVLTVGAEWAANRDDALLALVPRWLGVVRTVSLERRQSAAFFKARPAQRLEAGGEDRGSAATHDRGSAAGQGWGGSAARDDSGARAAADASRASVASEAAVRGMMAAAECPGGSTASGRQPRAERVARGASWLRRQLGHLLRFPDAHLGWAPFAILSGLRLRNDVDVLYSSSGPYTAHLVGLVLKKLLNKPWVVELRDGWYLWNRAIFPDYPGWRGALERRLESQVIHSADRVVLVTERMADAFRTQYADLPREHFCVISNGFDPRQVQADLDEDLSATEFGVVHTGALYYGRSIVGFLDAAHALAQRDEAFRRKFRLRLLGTLDGGARAEVEQHPMRRYVEVRGQVEHAVALEAMRRAAVLLLVANTTALAEATVPGKLFEYLAVGRPILAVAPRVSATADVLVRTGGAWLAPADDAKQMECALRDAFAAFMSGVPCAPDPRHVARYNRAVLAGDLARVFDTVVSSRAAGARGGAR